MAARPARREVLVMNNICGLAVFALGIVLLIIGFDQSDSFRSSVAVASSGSTPSAWLVGGGAVSVMLGLFLAVRGLRQS